MSEKANASPERGESLEGAVLRRRRLLKRGMILGVPLLLTLPGKAFAGKKGGGGSGSMSGSMSGGTPTP